MSFNNLTSVYDIILDEIEITLDSSPASIEKDFHKAFNKYEKDVLNGLRKDLEKYDIEEQDRIVNAYDLKKTKQNIYNAVLIHLGF